MASKARRIYKGKDSHMLSQIMHMLGFFTTRLSAFETFDPVFNAAYRDAWNAALSNIAKYYDTDTWGRKMEVYYREDVDKHLAKCQAKYRDVKYFASKAFPDSREALREFGEAEYSKVRNSPLRMVPFMEMLHAVAMKYKTELIAQNYSQAAIDEIPVLVNELREANRIQQMNKKERPTETRKRIEALNLFYGFGQKVSEAAREIYRDHEVYRDQFRLGKRHHPRVTKRWFTIGISKIRKTPLTRLLKKFNVALTNQGKETVEYWRADTVRETPAQKFFLKAGESIDIKKETPVKKFLVVKNISQKEVRLMLTKEAKVKVKAEEG